MKNKWFDVDKEGLAKILERKGGKSFAIFELIQNAWDENVKTVSISLIPISNKSACKIVVIDDSPEGFSNISHAFTLFADSKKKSNPNQRGRFNLGEKLVLACCEEAKIVTTKGTVIFINNGKRITFKKFRPTGSKFEGIIRMTRNEFQITCKQIETLKVPQNIKTIFNGKILEKRTPITSFKAILPTEISDEEGRLKRTKRKTTINVYKTKNNEIASIYEMGIPVVETNDKFHVDIQQKVPVNLDRDNVSPSFLKDIRTFVLNHVYNLLETDEDYEAAWVNNALEDERINSEAVETILNKRFGKEAVSYDPSDLESNKLSTSQNRPVIYGRTFNKKQWKNIRKTTVLPPAGKITPSPKPFDKNGKPLKLIAKKDYTKGMKNITKLCKNLAKELMNVNLTVNITNNKNWKYKAVYGDNTIYFNKYYVKDNFFNEYPNNLETVLELIIHEFGHEYSEDHLSEKYYDALCSLGAKLAKLLLEKPYIIK